MSIIKTRAFAKDAKAEGLTDEALIRAIQEVRRGLVDADLGGSLVKKRIATGNRGKSGELRTILVCKGISRPHILSLCVCEERFG
jgi:hypothetical protein